ncbi:MAG: hypothetical protein U5L04_02635 [Trueperaceae bacterium]|nr:hypothetical protein [Trueperaceae bacterium]
MAFHSQHQYIAYFAEFPQSRFTSVSGGDSESDITQQHGGGGEIQNIVGPETVSAVTLQKPHDHVIDQPLHQWNRAWKNGVHQELTLIVQPVSSEGIPLGEPDVYKGCARQSYSKPDVNRGASDTAILEISVQPTEKV